MRVYQFTTGEYSDFRLLHCVEGPDEFGWHAAYIEFAEKYAGGDVEKMKDYTREPDVIMGCRADGIVGDEHTSTEDCFIRWLMRDKGFSEFDLKVVHLGSYRFHITDGEMDS